ncbi:virulence-associated E family protein [Metabacillus dongyingensis]|uniref:VapE domain-containing protein n=1 Tax=Metabacillus dongyingensis TaxID=2874282 RepID=UPI003B8CAE5D
MNNKDIKTVYNKLESNSKNEMFNNHKNVLLIFNEDQHLKNIVRTNEFTRKKEVNIKPVWRKQDDDNKLWTDEDESQLFIYFGINYDITHSKIIKEVLDMQFYQNSYNPVKEYLAGVNWDGEPRLETIFVDYLGAQDNEYVREVTKITFTACVKRIMEPGCKHDTVLVLVGGQGIGKSHILSRLGMDWYNESIQSFKGDEAFIKISSSWIIELSELTALKSADIENSKAFISAKEDVYRPKYAKHPIQSPRRCVFFGTTNNKQFLKDETGNRRWLPIEVNKENRTKNPFKDLDQETVNQLWAEANFFYQRGDKTYLDDPKMLQVSKRLQEEHKEENGRSGMIKEFLKIPVTEDWYELGSQYKLQYFKQELYKSETTNLTKRKKVCALEIWRECYFKNESELTKKESGEINQILRSIPYLKETRTRFGHYGQQRGFLIQEESI